MLYAFFHLPFHCSTGGDSSSDWMEEMTSGPPDFMVATGGPTSGFSQYQDMASQQHSMQQQQQQQTHPSAQLSHHPAAMTQPPMDDGYHLPSHMNMVSNTCHCQAPEKIL